VTKLITVFVMNSVTLKVPLKAAARLLRWGLLNVKVRLMKHKSVTKIITVYVINSVTPKAAAKQELLFPKLRWVC
jgi:hypothetical protein